jgi:lipopolysaccharide transport system ATP-binding protein
MNIILKAENISKQYRLGTVGTGTLSHDFNRWWHRVRGKDDPYLKVGATNDRSAKATDDYVWALRDINFEVKQGEVLAIIGKNGAGKSTLLKILSRVTAPTTGSIKTKGRIASLLEVGTGFHPELTGRENIYLNGAILGMAKTEIASKLDEIVNFSGCEMYIDTPTKRYSSGMTVRLAFAVAAHLEPEILVVDEVLAVGDAEFQKKAIGKMQDISRGEGRTVLFVSHNMAAVKNLCSRAVLLEHGSVVYEGGTDKTVEKYISLNRTTFETIFIPENQESVNNVMNLKIFQITSKIRTGGNFSYKFEIESSLDTSVDIAVGFKDLQENKIFQIFSEHSQQQINLKRGINIIEGGIDSLPLVSSIYKLSLWVGSQFQTYFFFPDCISTNVEEGGLIKGSIALNRGYSVITKSKWNVEY